MEAAAARATASTRATVAVETQTDPAMEQNIGGRNGRRATALKHAFRLSDHFIRRLEELSVEKGKGAESNGGGTANVRVVLELEANFRHWRLSRQFRKTQEEAMLQVAKPAIEHHKTEVATITDVETDEDDECDHRDFFGIRNTLLLQRHFSAWRESCRQTAVKTGKADCFRDLGLKAKAFARWKHECRSEKRRRLSEATEAERERVADLQQKADQFSGRLLVKRCFKTWRRRTRAASGTRRLRELEAKKAEAKAKVDKFMRDLRAMRTSIHKEMDKHTKTKPVPVSNAWKNKPTPSPEKALKKKSIPLAPLKTEKPPTKAATSNSTTNKKKAEFNNLWGLKEVGEFQEQFSSSTSESAEMSDRRRLVRLQRRENEVLDRLKEQLESGRAVTDPAVFGHVLGAKKKRKKSHEVLSRDVWDITTKGNNGLHQRRNAQAVQQLEQQSQRRSLPKLERVVEEAEEDNDIEYDDADADAGTNGDADDEGSVNNNSSKAEIERRKDQMHRFRKIKAEEKRRRMLEDEAARMREEAEEKERKKEEFKQRRNREKDRERERVAQRERQVRNAAVAEDASRLFCMRAYGLRPWLALMADLRLNSFLAEKHRERSLQSSALAEWKHHWRSSLLLKNMKAERLSRARTLSKFMARWRGQVRWSRAKVQAAQDHRDVRVSQAAFRLWREASAARRRVAARKERMADRFCYRKTLSRALRGWLLVAWEKEEFAPANAATPDEDHSNNHVYQKNKEVEDEVADDEEDDAFHRPRPDLMVPRAFEPSPSLSSTLSLSDVDSYISSDY